MQNPLSAPQLPTPKARERSGDRTRRRLFETALAEFRRVGVTDASIGRIAETAGVSRPTFYFHFPTKDHVLLELQWSLEEPIAARMEAAKTLDDALAALVDGLVGALGALADPDVFAEMVRIYTRHAAGDAMADQPHYLMRAVAARFVEADADGRLPSGLDPERATHLFLTSLFGYLSLPVEIDESRRDLQTLISLFLTAPRSSGARRTRR
jgi:AcrR family transcriptional regulator